jgi:hypothetical protein
VSFKGPTYGVEDDGVFVIRNFHRAAPFASFLPGVAGQEGKPLWCFYVNRGQAVVSAGIRDKDGAFLEFFPADQAYGLVSRVGFRTFLRDGDAVHEAFSSTPDSRTTTTMRITPHDLVIEEDAPAAGYRTRVEYFTLPNELFPALARRVTVTSTARRRRSLLVLDGLPRVVPHGAPAGLLKNMSRTLEVFYDVAHLEKGVPFFKLRVEPSDRPDVVKSRKGFFYWSDSDCGRSRVVAVHPEDVFGANLAFADPEVFRERGGIRASRAYKGNRTPCAFTQIAATLAPGQSVRLDTVIGAAESVEELDGAVLPVLRRSGLLERKASENRGAVEAITGACLTVSADPRLDAYLRQSFLDNALRGGIPTVFRHSRDATSNRRGGQSLRLRHGDRARALYLYSRKHGDLERDYNHFVVEPTLLSQGNGNFRDLHQNRRSDIHFEPELGTENIRHFYSMIQLDGNNPLGMEPERFRVRALRDLKTAVRRLAGRRAAAILPILAADYRAGDLLAALLEAAGPKRTREARALFARILCDSEVVFRGRHLEGYWVDHWKYGLDLIEAYLGVHPEGRHDLLFGRSTYTWHDESHRVLPREATCVLNRAGVRRLGTVLKDPEKEHLIAGRKVDADFVHDEDGRGAVLKSTLFEKLLVLAANKFASLDVDGRGIEMSSDKPGWNDSMNGLPAQFGSSMPEVYELRRMAEFLKTALAEVPSGGIAIFDEARRLIRSLLSAGRDARKPADFWEVSHAARELFLDATRFGVSGTRGRLSSRDLAEFLDAIIRTTDRGIRASFDRASGLPVTYYIHEAKTWKRINGKSGRPVTNPVNGLPCVKVASFRKRALPLYLEAVVHACRLFPERAAAMHKALLKSPLYDRKLGMLKLNASLDAEDETIGRGRTFRPGFLENESIWLHMEYKYFLELLRAGLHDEFHAIWKRAGVPNLDPKVYGRSIFENSSFICSSAYPDPALHGRGFVARLSGSTAELVSMRLFWTTGERPFQVENGELVFSPRPALPGAWFTRSAKRVRFGASNETVPANAFGFAYLGETFVVIHNPSRRNTWKDPRPRQFTLHPIEGGKITIEGSSIRGAWAKRIREKTIRRIDIEL